MTTGWEQMDGVTTESGAVVGGGEPTGWGMVDGGMRGDSRVCFTKYFWVWGKADPHIMSTNT